jgi:hypothetical protein
MTGLNARASRRLTAAQPKIADVDACPASSSSPTRRTCQHVPRPNCDGRCGWWRACQSSANDARARTSRAANHIGPADERPAANHKPVQPRLGSSDAHQLDDRPRGRLTACARARSLPAERRVPGALVQATPGWARGRPRSARVARHGRTAATARSAARQPRPPRAGARRTRRPDPIPRPVRACCARSYA